MYTIFKEVFSLYCIAAASTREREREKLRNWPINWTAPEGQQILFYAKMVLAWIRPWIRKKRNIMDSYCGMKGAMNLAYFSFLH